MNISYQIQSQLEHEQNLQYEEKLRKREGNDAEELRRKKLEDNVNAINMHKHLKEIGFVLFLFLFIYVCLIGICLFVCGRVAKEETGR
jgi:hypothetical protein